jgi:uncharacterized protein YecT (DUF1311 family)
MPSYSLASPRALAHILLVALVAVCGSASCALAQTASRQPDCGNATTTAAMRECAGIRYNKAEQELKAVRAQLSQKLDETGKAKLQAAQAAWVQFRKANSEFQADLARAVTLAPLIQITVMADMTEARVGELQKALKP